ncbi:hypothetical protein [Sciscionella sediminilitoris]|uniref:hypothetical protein n=1 Tax=Sciscionella sediminilitoris TaxID=1445613 RepID=UPI0004DF8056|nr:hypothetical protein [Sciscionella sp. SE31]
MSTALDRLTETAWCTSTALRAGLERRGLPVPDAAYLDRAFTARDRSELAAAIAELGAHFARAHGSSSKHGAEQVRFGALLVPDPARLDTRTAVEPELRAGQTGITGPDFVDARLPAGRLVTEPGRDWSLFATVLGPAGPHFGSDETVRAADPALFTVRGTDTRTLMVRQLWGARVLQSGASLPDCEIGGDWTFSLLPGEDRVAGKAVSGTILHGKVRFRLGRADRGIAVARVCPALPIR